MFMIFFASAQEANETQNASDHEKIISTIQLLNILVQDMSILNLNILREVIKAYQKKLEVIELTHKEELKRIKLSHEEELERMKTTQAQLEANPGTESPTQSIHLGTDSMPIGINQVPHATIQSNPSSETILFFLIPLYVLILLPLIFFDTL